jgi:hypothetical protein
MAAYAYVWRFTVPERHRAAFESLYGADGAWARLFATSPDWLGTDLLADDGRPGWYLTVDRWTSRAACDAFRRAASEPWDAIDAEGAALTTSEELIGHFELIDRPGD